MLPIILAHGYLGFGELGPFAYFNHVADLLAQLGITNVHATAVDPKGSIEERATALGGQIRALVPAGKVHVIAHSMGGLDVRYLVGHANGADMIRTFTALGSPFGGTLAADIAADPRNILQVDAGRLLATVTEFAAQSVLRWPFQTLTDGHFALQQLQNAISGVRQGDYSGISVYFSRMFTLQDAALEELTTASCRRMFPADCSDLGGIPCYSYAGVLDPAKVTPLLTVPALVLQAAGQSNDGVVPLVSARLPTHLGTFPLDHFGLVGWSPGDISGCYGHICQTLAGL
jgi:pimeloyl-ACP methyl ester carboxylesterase